MTEALVQRCEAGHAIPNVERPLAEAILSRARQACPSVRVFSTLINWDVALGEEEALKWMARFARTDWALVTDSVGRAILARKWVRAAKILYNHYWKVPELRPAVNACQELLPTWERFKLSWHWPLGPSSSTIDTFLVNRVAELGASLAPDHLDYLWERAGGERKRLKTYGTPDFRWRDAATLSRNGSLPGGLVALVQELLVLYPHNHDLQELSAMLANQH
ncbi:effector-associated domain EAD1-containing protein [Myxococcus sp. AB036A]|uniref:effector-associated domain EAD1-containing protein n=1 Tax=Myxococcus sp. AB036A TaxID=2562793 RepID=UPI001146E3C5|nr:effector-associated domain EAD1-containing protein [Myxococcus sp. AB036A]